MQEKEFQIFLEKNFPFSGELGIGDDCSVEKQSTGFHLCTKDILIEDVHFKIPEYTMKEIAVKSLAVNISDITAMGGKAKNIYLGLGFPDYLDNSDLSDFFTGLKEGCEKWNVELAGGDYSSCSKLFISVTATGKTLSPVYRSGAETGDLICVTRPLGESALGLKQMTGKLPGREFIKKHKNVEPEIKAGLMLSGKANSMLDISDGFIKDLKRILFASDKGADIFVENFRVSDEMDVFCKNNRLPVTDYILAGGEDYALLFTVSEKNAEILKSEGLDFYTTGIITDSKKTKLFRNKREFRFTKSGYDHFKE